MARFLLLGALGMIFVALPTGASADIRISEIAWMGTVASANDEWIELENTGDTPILVDGWTLGTTDGQPLISLKGMIAGKSYFLLERTDDMTVPNIPADVMYKGSLSNSGEHLLLKNEKGETVDQLDARSGWSFGSNATKETMQLGDSGWGSGKATPRAKNIVIIPVPEKSSAITKKDSTKKVVSENSRSADAQTKVDEGSDDVSEEANERNSNATAAVSGSPSSQFGENMLWLVASISAGLLVGLGVRLFMRSRER